MMRKEILVNIVQKLWLPAMVLIVHLFITRILHGYDYAPWLDIVFHFLGGFSIGFSMKLVIDYLQKEQLVSQLDKSTLLAFVFCIVATTAVFWEFAEFLIDQVWGTNIQISLENTMRDLLAGVLGGLVFVGYAGIKHKPNPTIDKLSDVF